MNEKLVILTGPTAVGKSDLALNLAESFNGEIICADSRTVYAGMDIATAKPTPADRAHMPHHLLDIVLPDEEFTLPDFLEAATAALEDIWARGKLPFVVGGTVLYLNALAEGWSVPRVPPDRELRERLEREATECGSEALYQDLQKIDPAAAEHINPLNVRRIVRALEVYYATGELFSDAQGKNPPAYDILKLALTLDRDKLYERADGRIEKMFAAGLIEEVKNLLAAGYAPTLPAMTSVGYAQVIAHLNGELSLPEAKERMRFTTHRYIRQQYSWFRRDPALHWLSADAPNLVEDACNLIKNFLDKTNPEQM
jgi:tRNA dimethylallyltransferase